MLLLFSIPRTQNILVPCIREQRSLCACVFVHYYLIATESECQTTVGSATAVCQARIRFARTTSRYCSASPSRAAEERGKKRSVCSFCLLSSCYINFVVEFCSRDLVHALSTKQQQKKEKRVVVTAIDPSCLAVFLCKLASGDADHGEVVKEKGEKENILKKKNIYRKARSRRTTVIIPHPCPKASSALQLLLFSLGKLAFFFLPLVYAVSDAIQTHFLILSAAYHHHLCSAKKEAQRTAETGISFPLRFKKTYYRLRNTATAKRATNTVFFFGFSFSPERSREGLAWRCFCKRASLCLLASACTPDVGEEVGVRRVVSNSKSFLSCICEVELGSSQEIVLGGYVVELVYRGRESGSLGCRKNKNLVQLGTMGNSHIQSSPPPSILLQLIS